MFKTMTEALALLVFFVFSLSCISLNRTVQQRLETVARDGSAAEIVGIQTKSGEYMEFRKGRPAIIRGDSVIGQALKTTRIDKADIQKRGKNEKTKTEEIVTKDGRKYTVISVVEENETTVIMTAYSAVSVPFSDIQHASIRKVDMGATILLSASIGLLIMKLIVPAPQIRIH
jgi:hypothetical protein